MNFFSMLNWPKKQPKKKWERVSTRHKTYDKFFNAVKAMDDERSCPFHFKSHGLRAHEAQEAYIHYFDKWIWEGGKKFKRTAEFFEQYIDDPRNPTNFWKDLRGRVGRGPKPPA